MQFKYALWDLDGTAMNSEPWHERALFDVMPRHFGPGWNEPYYHAQVGYAYPLPNMCCMPAISNWERSG